MAWLALLLALMTVAFSEVALCQDTSQPATPPATDGTIPDQRLSTNFPGVVDPSSYEIGPEDVIQVRVWREPELSV